jgi:hypothetical protein
MAKYIAFDMEDIIEYFDTEEEARKWCEESLEIRQGDDDGISESAF